MHPSKHQLGEALKPLLKERGYRKRAMTWHRANEATIQVFQAEKCRWGGDSYTIHLCIYLRDRGPEETPPYYRCQIQTHLHSIASDRKRILSLCNFANGDLALADRLAAIVDAVRVYGLPWLDSHSSVPALKELAKCDYGELFQRGVLVRRAEYDYLRGLLINT